MNVMLLLHRLRFTVVCCVHLNGFKRNCFPTLYLPSEKGKHCKFLFVIQKKLFNSF